MGPPCLKLRGNAERPTYSQVAILVDFSGISAMTRALKRKFENFGVRFSALGISVLQNLP